MFVFVVILLYYLDVQSSKMYKNLDLSETSALENGLAETSYIRSKLITQQCKHILYGSKDNHNTKISLPDEGPPIT